MKHRRTWSALLTALIVTTAAATAAAGTLDPLLGSLLRQGPDKGRALTLDHGRILAMEAGARADDPVVGVVIELEPGADAPADVPGLRVGSRTGVWATGRLPLSSLARLAASPGVRHVHASQRLRPAMDLAVPAAGVNQVWQGSPAYTGDGVLVGVIDSGLDWRHPDFDDAGGQTRILAIWDQYATGTPPSGFAYGSEYTSAQINAGTVAEADYEGHGTHVTGIAAGNGRASTGQYSGVAVGAEILFAKAWSDADGGFAEDKVIDAMNYLVQKADALGRPIAINMSLGGHFGAHDGTRPQEQVLNSLVGEGVAICVAAGNEGESYVHDEFSAAGGSMTYRIVTYTPNAGTGNDFAYLSIWVDGAGSPSVTVSGNGQSVGPVFSGNVDGANTTAGTVVIDNASGGADPANGDKLIMIQWDDRDGVAPAAADWTVTLNSGSGTAHAWHISSSMTAGLIDSDQRYSVGMPGTAAEAITVAALKTRNTWPSQAGVAGYGGEWGDVPLGARAPFSSIGPTRDGRQKPDLAAPGMAIVSCYSRDSNPAADANQRVGSEYMANQGTSMATPLLCGVVAMMFEKNPTLTGAQIRDILRATATADAQTGAVWNDWYGAGKLSAPAALAAVTGGTAGGGGDVDADGRVTVLDMVLLINHILDPVGHALDTAARSAADVYPASAGDGTLDALDLARLVALVLGQDKVSPIAATPVLVRVDAPETDAEGRWLPISVTGDALAAGQFVVRAPAAGWADGPLDLQAPGDVTARARVVGGEARVMFFGLDAAAFARGVTLRLPLPSGDASLEGLLLGAPGGAERSAELVFPTTAATLDAWPNPAPGHATVRFTLPRGERAELAVYDLRGRMVRRLARGDGGDAAVETAWDGRDDAGHDLAPGVYMLRLTGERTHAVRKVVLRR